VTTKQPPHHNTLTCYTRYNCRLPECVARKQRWVEERDAAIKAGTWQPHVDAAPVRHHITQLLAAGLLQERIAALAEVPHQTIADFIGGVRGRGIRHRTSPEIAARILAIDPDTATSVRVDATGARRRVQALVAIGWPLTYISTRSGLYSKRVDQILRSEIIRIETQQRISDGYDTLRSLKPELQGVPKHKARHARRRAAEARWAPPKYWDQFPGAIDDPHFTPEYGRTRAELLAEEASFLMGAGLTADDVAPRLGISRGYLLELLRRDDLQQAA